jgi:hypothetical protein
MGLPLVTSAVFLIAKSFWEYLGFSEEYLGRPGLLGGISGKTWASRRNIWEDLGFSEEYLRCLCYPYGFDIYVVEINCDETGMGLPLVTSVAVLIAKSFW